MLTDIFKIANRENISVSLTLTNEHEVMGVNNMYQLSIAEEQFQTKLRKKFMEKGVILQNPETIHFSYDTKVESNVKIGPNNVFGKSVVIKKMFLLEQAMILRILLLIIFLQLDLL